MWNLSTDVRPQNYRNWPYANFTFSKSVELVPILHTVWNLQNVKFAVQQSLHARNSVYNLCALKNTLDTLKGDALAS